MSNSVCTGLNMLMVRVSTHLVVHRYTHSKAKVFLRPQSELQSPLGNGLRMCWKETLVFLPFQAEHSRPRSVSMTKADRGSADA